MFSKFIFIYTFLSFLSRQLKLLQRLHCVLNLVTEQGRYHKIHFYQQDTTLFSRTLRNVVARIDYVKIKIEAIFACFCVTTCSKYVCVHGDDKKSVCYFENRNPLIIKLTMSFFYK